MLRKGALESGLGEIILTVLVAAVISGAMFGPLGAKIGEGFQEAEQFTDITTQVTVSDSETLGDLAQYSFWRAWGCDKVQGETFSGLTSTNLTEDGLLPCAGAGGTAASSVQNLYSNTGNDMEGKYSRVNFVINETITLKTGEGFGPDNGKSAVLLGVSTGDGFDKAGYSDWIWGGCAAYDAGVSDGYMRGENWESQGPPYSYHTLFFKNGGGTERVVRYGNGATIEDRYDSGGQNDPLYCNEWNDGPWLSKPSSKTGNPKDYDSTGDSYVAVKLCPGDKGYVETRKGYPTTTGESTGSIGSNNNDELYGMIQITQMNQSESCGFSEEDEAVPPLNPMPDQWPAGSAYTQNPTDVDYHPEGSYQPIIWNFGGGEKSVNISMTFQELARTRIQITGNRYLEFSPDGGGKLGLSCFPHCNNFADDIWVDTGENEMDDYGFTGVTVEENKQYSVVLTESDLGDTIWEVYEEGEKVYELSGYNNWGYEEIRLMNYESSPEITFDVNEEE